MLRRLKQLLFFDTKTNYTRYARQFSEKQLKLKSGLVINYAEAGSGEELIFLHGLANNWKMWIPLAMKLKERYKVILIDMPGYGKSTRLSEYSLKISAKVISKFVIEGGFKPLSVVGLSLGSQIAATLVNDYPQIAKTVILNGPIFKIHDIGHFNDYLTVKIHNAAHLKIIIPILKRYIKNTFLSYTTSKFLNYYEFRRSLLDNYTREGRKQVDPLAWLQLSADAADIEMENIINKLTIPVLLVFGDHDKWTSLEGAKSLLTEAKSRIEYVKIKNAGHSVSTEKSAPVGVAIKKFLAELEKSANGKN